MLDQRSGIVDLYSFRDHVVRARSRPRAAVSVTQQPVAGSKDLVTFRPSKRPCHLFSRGCGSVGVRHLATHFLLDQQFLLPNKLACL